MIRTIVDGSATGFHFEDTNGEHCILAECNGYHGLEFGVRGVPMHLTESQIKDLIPILQHWEKFGELPIAKPKGEGNG